MIRFYRLMIVTFDSPQALRCAGLTDESSRSEGTRHYYVGFSPIPATEAEPVVPDASTGMLSLRKPTRSGR